MLLLYYYIKYVYDIPTLGLFIPRDVKSFCEKITNHKRNVQWGLMRKSKLLKKIKTVYIIIMQVRNIFC